MAALMVGVRSWGTAAVTEVTEVTADTARATSHQIRPQKAELGEIPLPNTQKCSCKSTATLTQQE